MPTVAKSATTPDIQTPSPISLSPFDQFDQPTPPLEDQYTNYETPFDHLEASSPSDNIIQTSNLKYHSNQPLIFVLVLQKHLSPLPTLIFYLTQLTTCISALD